MIIKYLTFMFEKLTLFEKHSVYSRLIHKKNRLIISNRITKTFCHDFLPLCVLEFSIWFSSSIVFSTVVKLKDASFL